MTQGIGRGGHDGRNGSWRIAMIDPGNFTPAYDRALCDALADAGHEVRLYGMADGTDAPTDHRQAWFYRGMQSPWCARLPGSLRRAVKGGHHALDSVRLLASRLAGFDADIVHCQWLPLPLVDRAWLAAQWARTPVVLTVHDSNPYNGAVAGAMRWGLNGAIRCADSVIAHTRQAEERLKMAGVAAERIHRVPHGLLHAAPKITPVVRSVDGRLRLLQFGKLRPYKGLDVLLRALASLGSDERARVRLRVVGRPYMDMAPHIEFARRHGLARSVEFRLDYVSDAEIGDLFADTDAAVFPYREIDASGAAMTAVAHGVPVLASAVGGFSELFEDGREARLVPPGDARAMASVLRWWIAEPAVLDALSAGMIQRRASIPDWRQIASQTLAVYAAAHRRWLDDVRDVERRRVLSRRVEWSADP